MLSCSVWEIPHTTTKKNTTTANVEKKSAFIIEN